MKAVSLSLRLSLPLSLLFAAGAVLADDAAILKCRTLPDTGARLACYDAMPVGVRPAAAPAPAARVAAAMPATPAVTPEQRFGMEQTRPTDTAPKSIESTIEGRFSGWGPTTRLKLANGQTWRIADGSSGEFPPATQQKVRIVRNVFGTMFLEIDGSNNSPKVRRVE